MVRELKFTEFTERLSPIFEAVLREANYPVRFNAGYFFSHWRRLMELGVAKTWESEGKAVLGALFVPELFSGEPQGICNFWFCLPEARGQGLGQALFAEFEKVAREKGCYAIFSSANVIETDKRCVGYLTSGFSKVETTFRKVLRG